MSNVRFKVEGTELVDTASKKKIPLTQFFTRDLPELGDAKLWVKDGTCSIVLLNGSSGSWI